MKASKFERILRSPINIEYYIILSDPDNIHSYVDNKYIKEEYYDYIKQMKEFGYLSDNNKITLKAKEILDEINKEEEADFYENLHRKLQEKMIHLTGKKQKMIQGRYAFLCNSKDLKLRLQTVIKKYKLEDQKTIEDLLLSYVDKANKAKFEMVQLIEYYIIKDGTSKLATDYENFDSKEIIRIGGFEL